MAPPPNILIFMTDHQRAETVAPWHWAITPHADRLAAEGVVFTQAFCPAPHCCPARATFFTGLYPSEHGVWNNVDTGNALTRGLHPGTRLFSDALREAGYGLRLSGKWHVSAEESAPDRGWVQRVPAPWKRDPAPWPRPHMDEWAGYRTLAQAPPRTAPRVPGEILRPGWGDYQLYGAGPHFIQDFDEAALADALAAIREHARAGQPWCHFIGMLGPHDPYIVPQRFLDLYAGRKLALPANHADPLLDRPGLYRRTRAPFAQLGPAEQLDCLRHYLAFCSYEDDLFGQVRAALEATGQLENTIILYLSDHGDYAGEHGLWAKGLPCFQGAYHIPAIVRAPGVVRQPGRTVEAFVSLADFAPTLLELAGLPPLAPCTGQSLVPFLHGAMPTAWRDALFTQSNGNELYGFQRSVMTREWKYVLNGFDEDELYDLTRDPGETRNLAADPRCAPVLHALCQRIWRFAHAHGDACVTNYVMVNHAPWGPAVAFIDDVPLPHPDAIFPR